VLEQKLK